MDKLAPNFSLMTPLQAFDKAVEAAESKYLGGGSDDIAAQKEINACTARWLKAGFVVSGSG